MFQENFNLFSFKVYLLNCWIPKSWFWQIACRSISKANGYDQATLIHASIFHIYLPDTNLFLIFAKRKSWRPLQWQKECIMKRSVFFLILLRVKVNSLGSHFMGSIIFVNDVIQHKISQTVRRRYNRKFWIFLFICWLCWHLRVEIRLCRVGGYKIV